MFRQLISAAFLGLGLVIVADSQQTCSNGVVGLESSNGVACCPIGCTKCGGSGCGVVGAALGLGVEDCCNSGILRSQEFCSVTGTAPCKVDPVEINTETNSEINSCVDPRNANYRCAPGSFRVLLARCGLVDADMPDVAACFDNIGRGNIEVLFLDVNPGLTTLPADLFAGLENVTFLNLRSNGFSSLPAGLFSGLQSALTLILDDNNLTELPAGVFDDLASLFSLTMVSNGLTSLPTGIFDGLGGLSALDISGNQLTELPAGLIDANEGLRRLTLRGNRLVSLPPGIFDGVSGLEDVDLSSNQFASLPAGLFANNGASLEVLNLSRNVLTTLPADLFTGLGALQTVFLFDNQLTSLPAGLFDDLVSATEVNLIINSDLQCVPSTAAIPDGVLRIGLGVPVAPGICECFTGACEVGQCQPGAEGFTCS